MSNKEKEKEQIFVKALKSCKIYGINKTMNIKEISNGGTKVADLREERCVEKTLCRYRESVISSVIILY